MPPPDDSFDWPNPKEELSPRRWRQRTILTLPGESAAQMYCGDPVVQNGQDSGCPVFKARTENSGSRKRRGDLPTPSAADLLVQPGSKRQRTSDEEHGE
ncbi:hypothetical protein MRX96_024930 [Rhipicephalus microplus]